jgi:hypothetical protein
MKTQINSETIEIIVVIFLIISILCMYHINCSLFKENFSQFTILNKKQINNPLVNQYNQMVTFPKSQNNDITNYSGDYFPEMSLLHKNNNYSIPYLSEYPHYDSNHKDFYKF